MYRIVFLIAGSLLLWGCTEKKVTAIALPYYNEPAFTPLFLTTPHEVETTITHRIGDFSFLNEDSVFISQDDIEGRIHVANFIFTFCGSICPAMIKNMKSVSDRFEKDEEIVFLSYSVTPWIDKPAVLKKYKTKNEIENPNWHFLTGKRGDIYTLARQSYFAEEDIGFSKDSSEFLHTEHFILVDRHRRTRGIYNGTLALEMEQLQEDILNLKGEPAAEISGKENRGKLVRFHPSMHPFCISFPL